MWRGEAGGCRGVTVSVKGGLKGFFWRKWLDGLGRESVVVEGGFGMFNWVGLEGLDGCDLKN